MSSNSLGDTLATTIRKTDKGMDKPGASAPGGVTAPPHFGDVGKAANDTFSKVINSCLGMNADHRTSPSQVDSSQARLIKAPRSRSRQRPPMASSSQSRAIRTLKSVIPVWIISLQGAISGELEGKYTDGGITLTQGWTTANALNTKIELDNQIARGVKLELGTTFLPSIASKNAKIGLHYRQQAFHTRAFLDLFKGPTFTADAVVAYEGFLLGGDIGYDVMEGRLTKYAAAVGYAQSEYSATIQAHNNFKTFSAAYHHRVSPLLEAAGKASFDPKATTGGVALEVAAKYLLDKDTFVKVYLYEKLMQGKINNNGIAAVSYVQNLRPGIKIGFGASIDTQRLQESAHKIGLSLEASG
jgi:voltage-dependent anion channel protein 2